MTLHLFICTYFFKRVCVCVCVCVYKSGHLVLLNFVNCELIGEEADAN